MPTLSSFKELVSTILLSQLCGQVKYMLPNLHIKKNNYQHSKKDSSAQEFHGLFTESFGNQFPSLGNEHSEQAWILKKLMLSYIILWFLVHWVHFPSLETAWKLYKWTCKECNACALQSFILCSSLQVLIFSSTNPRAQACNAMCNS